MAGIDRFEWDLWRLSLLLQSTAVVYLLATRKWLRYRGLCFYLSVNILQSVFLYYCYTNWGFLSMRTKQAAWASQIPVLLLRAWAVADIARLLLRRYSGIWELAWRILTLLGTALVLGSLLTAGRGWAQVVPNLNISLEWTTVCMIVALFLFAHHYEIPAAVPIRRLALGFLLYSSFAILNAKLLSHWLGAYSGTWNLLGTLSFLASVCLWLSAVFKPVEQVQVAAVLPEGVYHAFTPELNLRLRKLTERLSRLWSPGAKHH
jgi:hypothetical protein